MTGRTVAERPAWKTTLAPSGAETTGGRRGVRSAAGGGRFSRVHVELPRAQFLAVLLFATAAAPSAAIILIHGNPFQHPFAVSPAPIADLVTPAT